MAYFLQCIDADFACWCILKFHSIPAEFLRQPRSDAVKSCNRQDNLNRRLSTSINLATRAWFDIIFFQNLGFAASSCSRLWPTAWSTSPHLVVTARQLVRALCPISFETLWGSSEPILSFERRWSDGGREYRIVCNPCSSTCRRNSAIPSRISASNLKESSKPSVSTRWTKYDSVMRENLSTSCVPCIQVSLIWGKVNVKVNQHEICPCPIWTSALVARWTK